MKSSFLKFFLTLLTLIFILIVYLSTLGIETDKFNSQIKKRIIQTNKNLELDLKKIKLTIDPFNFKINAKTVGATIFFSKRPLPLEYIKSEVSLVSLLKNKIISSSLEIVTRSILVNDLLKFIRVTNNKPELFLLEKTLKKGHIILDLRLNFDEDGNIKNDYQIKGLIKDANVKFLNKSKFKNINLNFNIKENNYLLSGIEFKSEKINFISEKINIIKKKNIFFINGTIKNNQSNLNKNVLKLLNINFKKVNLDDVKFSSSNKFSFKIDNKFNFKDVVFDSDIIINQFKYKNPDIIKNYFSEKNDLIIFTNHKLNLNYKNKSFLINGEGEVQLETQKDKIKYLISKKGNDFTVNSELILKNINLKGQKFLKIYFPKINDNINFDSQKINIYYKNNIFSIAGSGKIKIEKDFDEINYFLEKKEDKINFNTELNIKNTNFKIDNINYKKNDKSKLSLQIEGDLLDNKNLSIKKLIINEENNKIKIKNLFLNKSNQIINIEKANFNYIDTDNKKNHLSLTRVNDDNYSIDGISLNANSLISNLLKSDSKNQNNLFKNNLSIDLNIDEVYLDRINLVEKLKGKLNIENNRVVEANVVAFFNNSKNITFTINTNENGEKITTLFSSKAKPLVDRYKFIKGFKDSKEGYLDFSSIKKNGVSNSTLVIDNFKVREIPALARLLALASLQGIADLLTGEGIRFTDFEMKFTNENKLMRIQELYAIGPAISILLEGYVEEDNLISLRGTLVPATTINRTIASIPLIGNLLIGKKVGEGVFGVSFKIKGPPQNLETTVNPIKTLTPRFITRTLEKIKKN